MVVDRKRLAALLTLAYTAVWLVTRWPAIAANALHFDDFGVPSQPYSFYIGPYRPLLWLEYQLWELLVPNHFWTVLPKLTGALYVGLACAALAILLERWGVRRSIAITLPLLVNVNPVLADAALWSTTHALALALFLILLGHIVWDANRPGTAAALIFAGIFGYQIFVSLSLVLIFTEWVLRGPLGGGPSSGAAAAGRASVTRSAVRKLIVVAALALAQVAFMELARRILGNTDGRGLAHVGSWSAFANEKLHGAFNLIVNGMAPAIAYYLGAWRALSLWKWVPVAIGLATAIATRRPLPFVFPFVVLGIPALPILAMSQSPYAWRVSVPMAFALALALLPLLMRLGRAAPAIAIVLAALMVPPSLYESRMRVVSHSREMKTIDDIVAYWAARGVGRSDFAIALGPSAPEDPSLIGPHDLTWGYERRTPAMWSSFRDRWIARALVEWYRGLRFDERAVSCTRKGITHLPERRLTIVCP